MGAGRQLCAVTGALVGISIFTVFLRLFTRIHLVKWVGPDDILILFGAVAVVSQAAAVFVGIDK
jgi:Na+/melibiose symporter-like transporter